jgi:hypothetical protein
MSICLRRREFVAGLGGAAAWPLATEVRGGIAIQTRLTITPAGLREIVGGRRNGNTFISALRVRTAAA